MKDAWAARSSLVRSRTCYRARKNHSGEPIVTDTHKIGYMALPWTVQKYRLRPTTLLQPVRAAVKKIERTPPVLCRRALFSRMPAGKTVAGVWNDKYVNENRQSALRTGADTADNVLHKRASARAHIPRHYVCVRVCHAALHAHKYTSHHERGVMHAYAHAQQSRAQLR